MNKRNKNAPRLGGALLDVIPRRFEWIQPLDITIIANNRMKRNTFGIIEKPKTTHLAMLETSIAYNITEVKA